MLRMTEVIKQVLPGHPAAALSGPNLAKEIMPGLAAASVMATEDMAVASKLQEVLHLPLFRLYTNDDVVGCEVAGALKNVIAIAAGMAEGLSAGDNTRAAVISRGLAELTRLGVAMGGSPPTFSGLAGMGDLIATCMSPQSRNRYVGEQLGRGRRLDEILVEMNMVAEGVKTAETVVQLAEQYGVTMPICASIHDVITRQHDGGRRLQRACSLGRPGHEIDLARGAPHGSRRRPRSRPPLAGQPPKRVVITRPGARRRSARRSLTTNVRCSQRSVPSKRGVNGLRPWTASVLSTTSRSPGSSTTAVCMVGDGGRERLERGVGLGVDADHQVGVEHHRRRVRDRRLSTGIGGPSTLRPPVEVALVDRGAEPRLEQRATMRRVEVAGATSWIEHSVVAAAGRRAGTAAAGTAAGAGGTPPRCGTSARPSTTWTPAGPTAVGGRHDVLHEVAAVLRARSRRVRRGGGRR